MDEQIPYGLKITFLVHFVVAVVFGAGFLLIPEMLTEMLGARAMEPSTFRLVGAAMLAFAASSWLAYRHPVWEKVKIVVQIEIVWTVLGVLAMLYGLIFEGLPAADWMNVVILGAFAVAFIFFYSRRR
jgi:divalent metal cation (Fe/Co/Zn/Cd) transporter